VPDKPLRESIDTLCAAAGQNAPVADGLVRLWGGIESAEDIIQNLEMGLEQV